MALATEMVQDTAPPRAAQRARRDLLNGSGITRTEWRKLVAWVVAGALGLACYVALYDRANPEASIDLTVGRNEAIEIGKAFLAAEGLYVADYPSAASFGPRHEAKRYLEKELPLVEANRLMRDEIAVWGWHCRWYQVDQQEEFWATVSPDGHVKGFWHEIEEAAPGERATTDEARTTAEAFLATRAGVALDDYALVVQDSVERPNRLDHSFQWERKEFKAADATYRIAVTMQGAKVGGYGEYLKIPEEWDRKQVDQASKRGTLQGAAEIAYWLLCAAAGVALLLELRAHRVRFRFAAIVVLVLAVVQLAEWANWWPLRWLGYDTSDSVGAFVGDEILDAVIDIGRSVLFALLFGLAGEALARRLFPDKPPLSKVLRGTFWRSRGVFIASFVGCCLALLHAGYVTLFYIGADALGAWSPQDWPYWNILATPLPWLGPLSTGLSAAIGEEFTFRLFAISFLVWVTKRRWIAVIVPAIIWGFLHSNYPQEPIYIRGIEITVIGIVYGLVFLRYGFFASFVSHSAFNALASSELLLRSHEPYHQISGLAAIAFMALPLVPGVLAMLRGKGLASNEEVWADGEPVQADPHAEAPVAHDPPPAYAPYSFLPRRRWQILIALAAVAAPIIAWMPAGEDEPFTRVEVDRRQAQAIADAFLTANGVDVASFRSVASFYNRLSGKEFAYLCRHSDLDRYKMTCRKLFLGRAGWRVEYFRPNSPEGYWVRILPDGRPYSYTHGQADDAPGDRLTRDEAFRLAESYLRHLGEPADAWRLVNEHADERPARNDYSFEWEYTQEKVADATWRVRVRVQGSEVHGLTRALDVPESWVRDHYRRELWDSVEAAGGAALSLVALGLFTWLLVHGFVRHTFAWRAPLILAGLVAGFVLAGNVNTLSTLWATYVTEVNPALFLTWEVLELCVAEPVCAFFASAAVIAVCEAMFRRAFPHVHPLSHWLGAKWALNTEFTEPPFLARLPLRRVWGEAILLAFLGFVVFEAADAMSVPLDRAVPGLTSVFAPVVGQILDRDPAEIISTPELNVLGGDETYFPAVAVGVEAFVVSVVASAALMAGIGIYRRWLSRLFKGKAWPPIVMVSAVMAMTATAVERSVTWGELPAQTLVFFLESVVCFTALWALGRSFMRDNLAAYAWLAFFAILFDEAGDLVQAGNAFERMNGYVLFAAMGALALVGLFLFLWGKGAAPTPNRSPAPPQEADSDAQVIDVQ